MTQTQELAKVEPTQNKLTVAEEYAYNYFLQQLAKNLVYILAPSVQERFFESFLAGMDCAEIRRLNPQFSLGQVVYACVTGKWHERKEDHIQKLLEGAKERVQQVSLESVDFISNLLTATHKQYGDAFKRYLQSGDDKELGEMNPRSIKQYKEIVELLMKVTGQDSSNKKISGTIKHEVEVNDKRGGLTSNQAAQILDVLVLDEE
jgi:hypothetical protein